MNIIIMSHSSNSLDAQVNMLPNQHPLMFNNELLSYDRWQALLQYKQTFLQSEGEDPRAFPYMNQEVAASWIRSRSLGVNPDSVVTRSNLTPEKLAVLLDEHRMLIDITSAMTDSFKDLLISCGYLLYLFDKTGVVLLNEGDWTKFTGLFTDRNSRRGIVADENAEGTTAHELCIRLKRPVQLLGPEHYCAAFQNIIASAAPIRDEKGDVQAALGLLSPPLQDPLGEAALKTLSVHSFALTTFMAVAIETKIQLNRTSTDLCLANEKIETLDTHLKMTTDNFIAVQNTLSATMEFIDEGIIAVDRLGKIIFVNRDSMRVLKLRPEDIGKRNIREFLGRDSTLMALVKNGEIITVEEQIVVGTERYLPFLVSIRPIINQFTNELSVAVLKLISVEKATAQNHGKAGNLAVHSFTDILTENEDFQRTISLARRFATSSENILLLGESGTGKELFAQAIHNSYCPQGPFVAVNCAAMPRELIGSELFGYEGGSFTGAERSGRIGKIELAHGGTLFLDEIGDMPLELQAVLLRTLEDKQVMRIGGSRYKKVNFRLVVATNKDLYQMMKDNLFREDLYFRLSVLTINIPPLRERGNDSLILCRYFIKTYCQKQGWKIPQLTPATQKIIKEHEWPGNIRQLQNAIIHAVNTTQDDVIKPENLPRHILADSGPVKTSNAADSNKNIGEILHLENLEKAAIETALLHANNCPNAAAKLVGISRSTLYRKLKEYNIPY